MVEITKPWLDFQWAGRNLDPDGFQVQSEKERERERETETERQRDRETERERERERERENYTIAKGPAERRRTPFSSERQELDLTAYRRKEGRHFSAPEIGLR